MTDRPRSFDPSRAVFLLGLPSWREGALPPLPVVVVAGRSNVGKSSFINMLLRRRGLARASSTPGRTRMLNFFDVDGRFVMADVPGYGFANAPKEEAAAWAAGVRDFVRRADAIVLVILLLDVRRDPSPEDLAFVRTVREAGRELLLVVTKADKEGRGKAAARLRLIAQALGESPAKLLLTSAEKGAGRSEVWGAVGRSLGMNLGGKRAKMAEGKLLDVVTIDGPAGAGKSTVARALAAKLGWGYLDTGAMYRAVGLKADRLGIPFTDDAALKAMCEATAIELAKDAEGGLTLLLDGEDVSRAIRENRVSALASGVSQSLPVREAMGRFQRRVGESAPTVTEGRDQGTVIFPDARLKVFLTASPEARAGRRAGDLSAMGGEADKSRILAELNARDEQDSNRAHAPLKPAPDAHVVDTTGIPVEGVVEIIAGLLAGS